MGRLHEVCIAQERIAEHWDVKISWRNCHLYLLSWWNVGNRRHVLSRQKMWLSFLVAWSNSLFIVSWWQAEDFTSNCIIKHCCRRSPCFVCDVLAGTYPTFFPYPTSTFFDLQNCLLPPLHPSHVGRLLCTTYRIFFPLCCRCWTIYYLYCTP